MDSKSINRMEETLSWVLRGGVLLSGFIILLGLVLMIVTGDTSCPFGVPDLAWIIWGKPFLTPSHVIFLGFAILIATPIIRIVTSILLFLKARDASFAVITALVLLILIVSFVFEVG